ncbi:Clavaminate synthase-like protein [Exidia glandulosa HHB12029]|uniref:Clavaminate synthase-like protein n=1 Tax=Exidia glandulosa HHB12029 TaxID=1314781 RepID=A0A165PAU0_EXIGL|nr:Clavaminate synthase-like protein [Exidia glandulosa HHB12029]
MPSDFTAVPILDYTLIGTDKPLFLSQLRHALIHVGFMYLQNSPVETKSLVEQIPRLFALPQESKDALTMRNSQHFLGYTSFGKEFTKGARDMREQFDFATPHENRWTPGAPEYLKHWGRSQWPSEDEVPGFRAVVEKYLAAVERLSYEFTQWISEALLLPTDALAPFFDTAQHMQHRAKLVKYPALRENFESDQGVGPHYDGGFLTFLLQASEHRGLQVQNFAGQWIDVPPLPNSFVVNIGKGLETLTRGVTLATCHRVVSPAAGSSARYSVPFFQNIAQGVVLGDAAATLDFPYEILAERDARGTPKTDAVNHTDYDKAPSGHVALIGRIKSHPDVAEKHYPTLFKTLFPDGLPAHVSAY